MPCGCMKKALEAVRKEHGGGRFFNSAHILGMGSGRSRTQWPSLVFEIPVPRKDGKGFVAKRRQLSLIAQRCPLCGEPYVPGSKPEEKDPTRDELAGMMARNRDVLVDLLSEVIDRPDAALIADRLYTIEQQSGACDDGPEA